MTESLQSFPVVIPQLKTKHIYQASLCPSLWLTVWYSGSFFSQSDAPPTQCLFIHYHYLPLLQKKRPHCSAAKRKLQPPSPLLCLFTFTSLFISFVHVASTVLRLICKDPAGLVFVISSLCVTAKQEHAAHQSN